MGIGYRATKSSKRRISMHKGDYLGAEVNWPAVMQETEVAGTSTVKMLMLSVFPSENFPKRDLSLILRWFWQSEAKDAPAFKGATPTPENISAVGPLFYLTTPSLLPRRQYLTGSHHRTLVRFRSLRTGSPGCHMGSASALLHSQSKIW